MAVGNLSVVDVGTPLVASSPMRDPQNPATSCNGTGEHRIADGSTTTFVVELPTRPSRTRAAGEGF